MKTLVDYTKRRKSKDIRYCPKCGKKGRYRVLHLKNDVEVYTHTAYEEKAGIFTFVTLDKECWII